MYITNIQNDKFISKYSSMRIREVFTYLYLNAEYMLAYSPIFGP